MKAKETKFLEELKKEKDG